MASELFEVRLTRQAEKDLKALRAYGERVGKELLALEQDPRRGHTLQGSLSGVRSLEFSLPGGQYRAAYVVRSEERRCIVLLIGPHENFYTKARRRYDAWKRSDDGE